MADVDPKVIEGKLDRGEELTPEEHDWFMQDDTSAAPGYAKEYVEPESDEDESSPEYNEEGGDDDNAAGSGTPKAGEEDGQHPPAGGTPPAGDGEGAPGQEDFFVRLEREMAKPDGQADLKDFTKREKAYFHQMKRDKQAKRQAESDRDAALFREINLKKQLAAAPKRPGAPEIIADLQKKDKTDFMTVEDVLGLLSGLEATPAPEGAPEGAPSTDRPGDPAQQPAITQQHIKYLQLCDKEARSAHPEDYDAVMELCDDIIHTNPEHVKAVREAVASGENPAELTYQLIKADPAFEDLLPRAQAKIEALKQGKTPAPAAPGSQQGTPADEQQRRAKAAQEAIIKNKQKARTTAHAGGSGEDSGDGMLSMESIAKMSDLEFSRLPKKLRDKYMKMYG